MDMVTEVTAGWSDPVSACENASRNELLFACPIYAAFICNMLPTVLIQFGREGKKSLAKSCINIQWNSNEVLYF